jgi:hypothetical protein
MAEQQGEHRRQLETFAFRVQQEGMRREFDEARRGQFCAFGISALFLGCGTFAALHGQPWVGTVFGAFGIGGIVTTFIRGRAASVQSEGRAEPEEKSPKKQTRRKR